MSSPVTSMGLDITFVLAEAAILVGPAPAPGT